MNEIIFTMRQLVFHLLLTALAEVVEETAETQTVWLVNRYQFFALVLIYFHTAILNLTFDMEIQKCIYFTLNA